MSKEKKSLFGLSGQAKERLIQAALDKRSESAGKQPDETETSHSRFSGERRLNIDPALCRFDSYPNYKDMLIQKAASEQLGLKNPFFRVHEGIAADTSVVDGKECINFSSYNYLGLSGDPRVMQAAKDAIDQYGTSASASRPVSGERPIQRQLEKKLAELYETEDCVVFVSGHATNVSTIGYLFGPNDLIIHDSLIHNSVLMGIQLSGAFRLSFPHNDWKALDRILSERRKSYQRVLIVTEGIYSMDGDYPDLPKFIDIKKRHKAFLMVDEAHSLGVMGERGKGIAEHYNIAGSEVDIWMGTLSKTLGGCGGYIAGEKALVDHLKFAAPGFLYSVGISPPLAAASLKALEILEQEPHRVRHIQHNGEFFKKRADEAGLDTGLSMGLSITPLIIGSSIKATRLSNLLFEKGINVQPIIYPAVEERAARLRFFICTTHTEEQIETTIEIIQAQLAKIQS